MNALKDEYNIKYSFFKKDYKDYIGVSKIASNALDNKLIQWRMNAINSILVMQCTDTNDEKKIFNLNRNNKTKNVTWSVFGVGQDGLGKIDALEQDQINDDLMERLLDRDADINQPKSSLPSFFRNFIHDDPEPQMFNVLLGFTDGGRLALVVNQKELILILKTRQVKGLIDGSSYRLLTPKEKTEIRKSNTKSDYILYAKLAVLVILVQLILAYSYFSRNS